MNKLNKLIKTSFIFIFCFLLMTCSNEESGKIKSNSTPPLSINSRESIQIKPKKKDNSKYFTILHSIKKKSHYKYQSDLEHFIARQIKLRRVNNLTLDFFYYENGPSKTKNDTIQKKWDITSLFEIKSLESIVINTAFRLKFNVKNESKLKSLQFNSCGFQSDDIQNFQNLKNLESLIFNGGYFSKEDIELFYQLKNLKHLTLWECKFDLKDLLPLKDQLESLSIPNSNVSNLEYIVDFKNKSSIKLNNLCEQSFSKEQYEFLGKSKVPISITLSNCEIDINDLLPIKDQLEFLNLSYSKVHNWDKLAEFTNLKTLYIAGIKNVILSQEDNIYFLKHLTNLESLSIKKNSVHNLEFTRSLTKLKELYIQETNIDIIPAFLLKRSQLKIHK